MMSQEMQFKVQEYRAKAREGTLTVEEMREAIQLLRQDRVRASATSAKAKTTRATKAAKQNIDSDDLLKGLEGL